MELVHNWFWFGTLFCFGAIIGSFLNVYLYRFHTGKSLSGHSHCMSCGKTLRWFELFPLFSYLALVGKCRTCHSRIPSRYFLVEGTTGLLFVLAYLHATTAYSLTFELCLVVLLLVTVVYDLYHLIIPNEFVIGLTCLAGISVISLFLRGGFTLVVPTLIAAVCATGFFAGLWYVSKGRWLGFGDVKLLFPLSIIVGAASVFSFVVLSFWIGAIISLLIMGQQMIKRGQQHLLHTSQQLTMKSEIPFAPFLIVGFLLAYYGGIDVLTIVSYVYR